MANQHIFAKLILRQVKDLITVDSPTTESAFGVLNIFTPLSSVADIQTAAARKRLWNAVKLGIHPDKQHETNKTEATLIFQSLDKFIAKCEKLLYRSEVTPPRQKKRQKVASKFPPYFNVETMDFLHGFAPILRACNYSSACLVHNMRGQMWHHGFTKKNIGLFFYEELAAYFKSLDCRLHGTISTETIKEEIIKNGPVLSRSYRPHSGECKENDYPVIVGWELQPVQGEVWLARIPSKGNEIFTIAFSTCDIEEDIAVPSDDPSNTAWQTGPYFSFHGTANDWKTWPSFTYRLSITEFMTFWQQFKTKQSMKHFIDKTAIFHVYNDLKADSREAYITDIEFVDVDNVKICGCFT